MADIFPRLARGTRSVWMLICCLLALFCSPTPAWAWGPLGHRVAAHIAQQHLGPKARNRLRYYFGKEFSLADLALWADELREERPETAPWHYINIPPQATTLKMSRDCPHGDCITAKLREHVGIARLALREKQEVIESVKFILHLAGDLHQPLHAGHLEDRGGNNVVVKFRGEEWNLHAFWDSAVVKQIAQDESALVRRVSQRITSEKEIKWQRGTLKEWTWETHLLAVQVAYGALPPGKPKILSNEYVGQAASIAEEQLAKAGVRLAELLNRTWP